MIAAKFIFGDCMHACMYIYLISNIVFFPSGNVRT